MLGHNSKALLFKEGTKCRILWKMGYCMVHMKAEFYNVIKDANICPLKL